MVKHSIKKKKPTALTVGSKRISAIPHKHNSSIADITWKSQVIKVIKYILTASGFMILLFGCCLTVPGDDKWYVPMLIGLGGAALMGIAVLIDYRQQFRADKSESEKQKVVDVWIEDIHIQMPAPLTDFELAYLSTIRKDNSNGRI